MKRPLGCLSGVGLVAALVTLLVVGGVVAAAGGAWFSPGRLSVQGEGETIGGVISHAETRGNCAACHPAPWSSETMGDRCAVCHAELQDETSHLSRFHALMWKEGPAPACRECHPEHRGIDAPLTIVSVEGFPHDGTGFSLAAHPETQDGAPFTCAGCHGDSLTSFEAATCEQCHAQIDPAYMSAHLSDFGPDCLKCHDGSDRFSGFDHGATAFALEGAHAEVRCGECHTVTTPAGFGAAATDCHGCHAGDDPHESGLGNDCAACHTADDWGNATFDHAATAFQLTGAHEQVGCRDCHAGGQFRDTPTACAGCHEDPAYHAGLFTQACDACHTSAAWEPARFDQPHIFPTNHGAPEPSACRTCHPNALAAYTCYGCHEHTPAKIQEEHTEEGLGDIADCVRCHPTGQEGEAEGGDSRGGDGGRGGDDD